MRARRTIPVRLRPTDEQAGEIDRLFSEYRRLISFLTECCKRTGITDYQELQKLMYTSAGRTIDCLQKLSYKE